ncbi:MAG: hypothetical protein ACPGQL_07915 [Thermoplasmatota archaeon]
MQRTTLLVGLLLITNAPAASAQNELITSLGIDEIIGIIDTSDVEGLIDTSFVPCIYYIDPFAPWGMRGRIDCLGTFCITFGPNEIDMWEIKTCDPRS